MTWMDVDYNSAVKRILFAAAEDNDKSHHCVVCVDQHMFEHFRWYHRLRPADAIYVTHYTDLYAHNNPIIWVQVLPYRDQRFIRSYMSKVADMQPRIDYYAGFGVPCYHFDPDKWESRR
jgi:hypothetical protein